MKDITERVDELSGVDDAREVLPLWKQERYVHLMFSHLASTLPVNHISLEWWDDPFSPPVKLTAQELKKIALTVTRHLIKRKTQTSKVAVIYMERSISMIVSLLAVAMAGFASVFVDADELSSERLRFILEDSSASVLLTTNFTIRERELESELVEWTDTFQRVDDIVKPFLSSSPPEVPPLLDHELPKVSDQSLFAVIYTSGSTGQPAGVCLNHGPFANYHAVEQTISGACPTDRVLHTQSLSFVSGIGEVWRAMCSGATLVLASLKVRRLGPDFLLWLLFTARITVFKAVPSMLRSMIPLNSTNDFWCTLMDFQRYVSKCQKHSIPVADSQFPDVRGSSLRLVISSGEALTEEIMRFFAARTVLINTYGSTEMCSNCLYKVCDVEDLSARGFSSIIGRPYPTFKVSLLDSNLRPVQHDEDGELVVSGLSLAEQYLNRDDLNEKRFVQHPTFGKLYRSGDEAKRRFQSSECGRDAVASSDGNCSCDFVFIGRKDSQVKVNGYRVELGEVEATLLRIPSVAEAAVVFHKEVLHAFICLHPNRGSMTLPTVQSLLRERGLGEYEMPSSVSILEAIPKNVSGKVDRRALVGEIPQVDEVFGPIFLGDGSCEESDILQLVIKVFQVCLNVNTIDENSHFFHCGGGSLFAGRAISMLRESSPKFSDISVMDLYANSTPKSLVEKNINFDSDSDDGEQDQFGEDEDIERYFDEDFVESLPLNPGNHTATPKSLYHSFWISAFQLLFNIFVITVWIFEFYGGLFIIFELHQYQSFSWFSSSEDLTVRYLGDAIVITVALSVFVIAITLVRFLLLFFVKWCLIGTYREGISTSRWFFLCDWTVTVLSNRVPWEICSGTPLINVMFWLLGASIGRRTVIIPESKMPFTGWDLLEIGDEAVVNMSAIVPITFKQDHMELGRICLKEGAVAHPRSVLTGGTTLLQGSQLGYLSSLEKGDVVGKGEYWLGSPAKLQGEVEVTRKRNNDAMSSVVANWGFSLYYFIYFLSFIAICSCVFLPLFFSFVWFRETQISHLPNIYEKMFASSGFFTLSFFWVGGILICLLKLSQMIFTAKPGVYPLFSFPVLFMRFQGQIFEAPQTLLNNTVYLVMWMRLCGAKIGARSEMSHVRGSVPHFINLGAETFSTNYTHIAAPEIMPSQEVYVDFVSSGNQCMFGNRSVLPVGTKLGNDVLLGVLSLPSLSNFARKVENDPPEYQTFIGNPALPLHHQINDEYPPPTRCQLYSRYFFDAVAISLVFALDYFYSFSILFILEQEWWGIAFFPVIGTIALIMRILIALIPCYLLRLVMGGAIQPKSVPNWSSYVHFWHIYTKVWAFYIRPTLNTGFQGTIWMNYLLQLFSSAKIGKDVYIGNALVFREYDLVTIGDRSVINPFAEFRTHTFENWLLKFAPVVVEDDCWIGNGTTIMGDSVVSSKCGVDHNSMTMKGERLVPGSHYAALPAKVNKKRGKKKRQSQKLKTEFEIEVGMEGMVDEDDEHNFPQWMN